MLPEIRRRRTFAIISHPDAGKTTLTEKLLLYGGALNLAGSVTARKSQRSTASDWMELERQRGISVSSTVLQFEHGGHCLNLLDTPGHRDFSEDTYRVLTAVDAAVMVIDAGKGIESQTRKLFEVCRMRGVPIFTFVNKLDRPARDPLELLDELEEVLGIRSWAVDWPLGAGPDFRGLYDRRDRRLHLFERTPRGSFRAPVQVRGLDDPRSAEEVPAKVLARAREELDLLDGAGSEFDAEAVLAGELTPVFFGSAVWNFGVELLLDGFVQLAPSPRSRRAGERVIEPADAGFSGFIFKIQANMDPRHRDRMAFLRICSGTFRRDLSVTHTRTGNRVRLSCFHRIFGREREAVEEAYPGDVVGLVGGAAYRIGDTLAEDPSLTFDCIPAFAPECFVWLSSESPSEHKRFSRGLEQLLQEGVVQSFQVEGGDHRRVLLGAVGPLQFDVVQHRLREEYGAASRSEAAPWTFLRWLESGTLDQDALPVGARLCRDELGRQAVLFPDAWKYEYFSGRSAGVTLASTPPAAPAAERR